MSFQVIIIAKDKSGNSVDMAHATVASLMRTMESLLISNSPVESLICNHRDEFRALREKVSSLEVFLKNFEKNNVSREMMDFEVEVKEVANAVEYTIQLTLTEILMEKNKNIKGIIGSRFFKGISNIWTRRKFRKSLQQLARDIDRVWKKSKKIQYKGKQVSKESSVQDFSSSAKDIPNVKNIMVGRDDQREKLLNLIRGYSGEPKVIPIIGMGGIGKTTLVREVYNDVSILSHFDVRAWATVSHQHNVKIILLSLLNSTIKMDGMVKMKDEAELADMLQKSLKGKRYLIVMDDIWSGEVWDDVRLCFPSENNAGSRILLTTRNNEVASYAGSENLSLQMGFMDQDDSWNLFKSAAFANEALPSQFETIGKEIAEKCHGLPLTIVVVAGLLKSKKTIEDWESVAKDVKSFVANDPDKRCLDVLGLSYNHLTIDLKACLLYFGIFPEDSEISVKRLMRLWMAEGFVKFEEDMEGEAEKCLKELVDRCLVLISKKSLDETRIRSCKVHDVIHDLCLREVQRGNISLMKDIVPSKSKPLSRIQRWRYHIPSESHFLSRMQPFKRWTGDEIDDFPYGLYRALLLTDDDSNNLLERTHSIFFLGHDYTSTFILRKEVIHFKLLNVLDLSGIEIDIFPRQILSLIWLKYLSLRSCKAYFEIPPEICRLWNLQTFIVGEYDISVTFPEQIWGLIQLRHLKLGRFFLPNCPSRFVDKWRHTGFSNLQTISYLSVHCCTDEVILGIPNVKKLGINGSSSKSDGLLNNLFNLQQLESLTLKRFMRNSRFPSAKAFPARLKKLKLYGTRLSWSYLDIIAELPNLEVLKLMWEACLGEEWNPNVRVFTRLKLLLIDSHYDLKYWKATNDNFLALERLFIRDCHKLKEIPIEFADIHSLQLIELKDSTSKLAASAKRIQQEQEDLGNNLGVVIIK